MTSSQSLPDLGNPESSGLVSLTTDQLAELRKTTPAKGLCLLELPLRGVHDEPSLYAACSHSLQLPEWFGHNADALVDCLTDLSWLDTDGYVLILREQIPFAKAHPDLSALLHELLLDVCLYWRDEGRLFLVADEAAPDQPHS
ncbi:barstar family protein [Viridibacterium curvum]|uniref:Barstar (barnase inhibitor) domain-containing protein n=1 Tax=Viridibacterium curvum TaxID=1101404 RepID=A0ABP9QFQ0_9RHOO